MHGFHHLTPLGPLGHIRLVGRDNQQKPGISQSKESLPDTRQNFEFDQRRWRIGFAVSQHGTVQHAIPVKKNRPSSHAHRFAAFIVVSHLVPAVCNNGCDTRQCQTTAWNASVCGVTRSGLTVGTTTTASPTFLAYPVSRPMTP